MGVDIDPNIIKLSLLKKLQETFQKEMGELIELYLQDARKKIANLYKALEEKNLSNFQAAARDLRYRSIEIGAIHFSYICLSLEIAVQEMRLENLFQLTSQLERKFGQIYQELNRLKSSMNRSRQLV